MQFFDSDLFSCKKETYLVSSVSIFCVYDILFSCCEVWNILFKMIHCWILFSGYTIFKETEMGRWVHLVCALYIPGVAFSEVNAFFCECIMHYSPHCNFV